MQETVILCVDDEAIVLRSLKRELNDAFSGEYLIEVAESGDEALEILEELLEDRYDVPVVISDYIMPGMKGDQFLQRVHEYSPSTRKIMLTGQASTEGVTNAVNSAGLYRYMAKPWEQHDLFLTVTEAIRSYRQEQEIEHKHRELECLNSALQNHNSTLEQKVIERTKELHASLQEVEAANSMIVESMQYAKMIQRSLLPDPQQLNHHLPHSFFLWVPRDIVGGDLYFTEFFDDGYLVAVLDCTGHGVPGALMTMIASSGLQRIIRHDGCRRPGEILKRLNVIVKTSLQQDTPYGLTDDGLDAAICFIDTREWIVTFAGARLPLYYLEGEKVRSIKGDRQSLGYRRADLDFIFAEHRVNIHKRTALYLFTDGYVDQLGWYNARRFGSRRFKKLLAMHHQAPLETQQQILLQAFTEYKGDKQQQDDLTVVGIGFHDIGVGER
jgi:serine phosphatase RsbU (regulator of sigma subunit)